MQTLTLLHSESFPISRYRDVLTSEAIAAQLFGDLDQLRLTDASALRVVLVDPGIIAGRVTALELDSRTAVVGVGLDAQPAWLSADSIYLHLPENPETGVLLSAVKRAYQFLYQKQRADQLERQLSERTRELQQVAEVGAALSTVRDHSVLLTMILSKSRELSPARCTCSTRSTTLPFSAGSSRRTIRSTSTHSKKKSCRSPGRASPVTSR